MWAAWKGTWYATWRYHKWFAVACQLLHVSLCCRSAWYYVDRASYFMDNHDHNANRQRKNSIIHLPDRDSSEGKTEAKYHSCSSTLATWWGKYWKNGRVNGYQSFQITWDVWWIINLSGSNQCISWKRFNRLTSSPPFCLYTMENLGQGPPVCKYNNYSQHTHYVYVILVMHDNEGRSVVVPSVPQMISTKL